MTPDPRVRAHQDWLGMLQPTGLFLAPKVLADAGAALTEPAIELQRALTEAQRDPRAITRDVLGWPDDVLRWGDDVPPELTVDLEGGVTLRPTFALHDLDEPTWVLLGVVLDTPDDDRLDAARDDAAWTASHQQRLERLLRARDVTVGVLVSREGIRVVFAPRGEPAAHATWRFDDLETVAGRPLVAALHMCLNARRLLTLAAEQRLPALLAASRAFQNTVSTRLQSQVLDALQELLDGLQRADGLTGGRLLAPWRTDDPTRQTIYHGLVTALLRVVFVLFAEERRLLPLDARLYREGYALTALHARLQDDHARLGGRIDARYGAYGQMVALFRMLHDGLDARDVPDGFVLPARRGEFFDPDRFAFLEGRGPGPRPDGPIDLPRISDGVVFRALDRLLVLDGERLKYSDLAVEQIGSVYEGIMGYTLELAEGRALRVRTGSHATGSIDVVVDLQRFTAGSRDAFVKHLEDELGLSLNAAATKALKAAKTEADVQTALAAQKSFKSVTAIDAGFMFLQPGEERRRSGSHYTPRSLTEPIVARTLRPVLARLGENPTPEAILALRVCDPAMGSGAFLVEVCRQLAVALDAAWTFHRVSPEVPADEDTLLHARRLVAQRCLYGVDRNALAVDLARLSLWLETFARDHAFTFVHHALRHGDSLVGCTMEQIASVSLDVRKGAQLGLVRPVVKRALAETQRLREEIHRAGDGDPPDNDAQRRLWQDAQDALLEARTVGDTVVAAFFTGKNDKERGQWLAARHSELTRWLAKESDGRAVREAVRGAMERAGVVAFHWELEFPEVFAGESGGFDAFVGNPPFLGGTRISSMYGSASVAWLKQLYEESHGNADLVAHFFRRAFSMLRAGGTMGFIATNTLAQGDTRVTGLRWICTHGGTIYEARRRYKWPGLAAVVVVVVHIVKGARPQMGILDGREVPVITSYLFHRGGHDSPAPVPDVIASYFTGSKVYGAGFTFDDREKKRDTVNSLAEMRALITKDPRNQERIFPYLGGEELNDDPEQKHHRYVINFGELSEHEARTWPDLMAIVETKVRPGRMAGASSLQAVPWWQYERTRAENYRSIQSRRRVLAVARVSQTCAFVFLPTGQVFSDKIVVFAEDRDAFFTVMQSRVHEVWARFFSSTMKDDLQYTPSDCFVTFPFPAGWEASASLTDIGARYHAHRAAMMARTIGTKRPEGLTATYNRFHDANERAPDVLTLRALHAAMDRAVLDAYGWDDVRPAYDFRAQLDERVRYTWDDDTRDEVLARLLEENRRAAAAT